MTLTNTGDMETAQLIDTLIAGGHSLVVGNTSGKVSTLLADNRIATGVWAFDGRGVSDLLRLTDTAPALLQGATIADKVVGKAAAALLIQAGVHAVWAGTISQSALTLFAQSATATADGATTPVSITYATVVDHIMNRDLTDWCPMERACYESPTVADSIAKIRAKLAEMRGNK